MTSELDLQHDRTEVACLCDQIKVGWGVDATSKRRPVLLVQGKRSNERRSRQVDRPVFPTGRNGDEKNTVHRMMVMPAALWLIMVVETDRECVGAVSLFTACAAIVGVVVRMAVGVTTSMRTERGGGMDTVLMRSVAADVHHAATDEGSG